MCGISGMVGAQGSLGRVEKMVAALGHRGPDASAVRDLRPCVLGHNRLRIIDTRGIADQPLSNETRTVWAVFNGEIYNFRELRTELGSRGHRFVSRSDSEVLVHLYEEFGPSLLEHLRGMFAFAIWDTARQSLLLARDRLGIKPLYYGESQGQISFASEAKALGLASGRLNPQSLASYLRLGWVSGPQTIFAGIMELPPGHLLEWRAGRASVRRWWKCPHVQPNSADAGDLRESLSDAFRRHTVADVPVGLFLSSGVDSVALAYLARKEGIELDALTIACEAGPDEASVAAQIASSLNLPHSVVSISGQEVLGNLGKIVMDMDQPTVDGVNSWAISRAAKQAGLTVALSGLGGDEMFAGYSTFRRLPRLKRIERWSHFIPARSRWAVAEGISAYSHGVGSRAAVALAEGGWTGAYAGMRGVMSRLDFDRLWPAWQGSGIEGIATPDGWDDLDTVTQLELHNYLPHQLLRDTDAMSMAHSLEVRVPLLDDEVVMSALQQPADNAVVSGKSRLALAVHSDLGSLVNKPKLTFTLPFDNWLRGPLAKPARDAISRLGEEDIGLDRWELDLVWERFTNNRIHWRAPWALAVLGLWVDANLGGI